MDCAHEAWWNLCEGWALEGRGEDTRCEVELLALWGVLRVALVLVLDLDDARG